MGKRNHQQQQTLIKACRGANSQAHYRENHKKWKETLQWLSAHEADDDDDDVDESRPATWL